MKNIISFIGLSHLSISYLLASISKGYKIIAYDKDLKIINEFLSGKPNIDEADLVKRLIKNKKKIFYSNVIKDIQKSKIIFIGIDVITNNYNHPNYLLLNTYLKLLKLLKLNKKIPLIVLSQINPGFMRKIKITNDIYYQVETLIFGQGYNRAAFPERIIVGKKNKNEKINNEYLKYLNKFKCPIFDMTYESAELCKIAINLLLASSVTASNVLASLAEKINTNYLDLIPALKADKRIGNYAYINPGLGISGGNIERDLNIIYKLLRKKKIDSQFINAIKSFSSLRKDWVYNKLTKLKKFNKVTILGLSYKKNNKSLKNSPSLKLIAKLKKNKIKFCIYDDLIKTSSYENFTNNINKAISYSRCIILMREFNNIQKIKVLCKYAIKNNKIIIDPFNILKEPDEKNKSIFKIGA
jgi:UDPglucose 6-dehydrogenase